MKTVLRALTETVSHAFHEQPSICEKLQLLSGPQWRSHSALSESEPSIVLAKAAAEDLMDRGVLEALALLAVGASCSWHSHTNAQACAERARAVCMALHGSGHRQRPSALYM